MLRLQAGKLAVGLAFFLAALAGSGCATLQTFQTANTLGQGNTQFTLEPSYEAATNGDESTDAVPRIDVAYRYGVSDTVDIGGRFGTSGFEFLSKFQLTDPADPSLVLSVAPSVGGMASVGGIGSAYASLPILIGLGLGGGSQLVIGPKLVDMYVYGGDDDVSGSVNLLFVGGSLGVSLALGESFRLMPEIAIAYPLAGSARATNGTQESSFSGSIGGGVLYQAGLAFLFGKSR